MRWEIDPNHSTVTIGAKHMMIATVRGSIRVTSGWIEFDENDPERGHVEVEIDAASVNTGVEARDADMRSERLLDVARHPTITFKSTAVERRDERRARVVGDLTLRGTTRRVVLESEFQGSGKSPWGDERIAFSATTTIDRRDFGMVWNAALETGGVLVGNDLKVDIEVEAKVATGFPKEKESA